MSVETRIKKLISEHLGLAESDITPEKTIEADLGADSLDRIELVMLTEDEFEIEINDDALEDCKTVQQFIDCVKTLVKE